MAADIAKLDLYALLEVTEDADKQTILKAYRKKALKCHPDKNPDNPKAAEEFIQLLRALELLTDTAARAAYDRVRKAKKAAEERNRHLDSKRRKLKEDLEARERAAQEVAEGKGIKTTVRTDEEKLKTEIERLRKEGSRLVEEEMKLLNEEIKQTVKKLETDEKPRFKLKWKAKQNDGGYSEKVLQSMLSKYGEISCLILSAKKKGNGVVEYATLEAEIGTVENERGLPENPLTVQWLSGHQKAAPPPSPPPPEPAIFATSSATSWQEPSLSSDLDFESLVLRRMRQAAERRKLVEQMQNDGK